MRDEKIVSYLKPLPTSKEIETLFDLIEKNRNNTLTFKALINEIISGNFHFYKKDTKQPERLPFNENLFDRYVIDKYEATAKHYKNNFGTNLIDYLERFSKSIDESIHKKNGLKKIEFDLNINSELINKFIEYYKNTYELKGAPVRKCTCTLEDRKLAFERQINNEVNALLSDYLINLNKELDAELRKQILERDINSYSLIFSPDFNVFQDIAINISYPPKINGIHKDTAISRMREFRRLYQDPNNDFRDYHRAECPQVATYIDDYGNEHTPPKKHHTPYSILYFFFLRLKEYKNAVQQSEMSSEEKKLFTENQFVIFQKLNKEWNNRAELTKYRFIFQYLKEKHEMHHYMESRYKIYIKKITSLKDFSLTKQRSGTVKESAYFEMDRIIKTE